MNEKKIIDKLSYIENLFCYGINSLKISKKQVPLKIIIAYDDLRKLIVDLKIKNGITLKENDL